MAILIDIQESTNVLDIIHQHQQNVLSWSNDLKTKFIIILFA